MKNALLLMTLALSLALTGCQTDDEAAPAPPADAPSAVEGPAAEEPGGDEPGGDEPGGDEPGGDEPGGDEPGGDESLPLSPDLCADPANLARLRERMMNGGQSGFGEVNLEQVQRMMAAPTEGPFYMVNLVKYRDRARYADGRPSELSGREANALYSPLEFITAIGGRVVFSGDVGEQVDGDDVVWDSVGIVEYPCPLAFFAMSAHPGFQARAVHKDAGVERTTVMVTHLQPSPLPEGFEPPESPFPATDVDPAFEMIHVMRFNAQAQYEDGADEPPRTGAEAWEVYTAGGLEAAQRIGSYPTARFVVQGVFIGDGRAWDQVSMLHMPSRAGFQALLDDEARQAGSDHRHAALADNYSLITYPNIAEIPGAPAGESPLPPVTADGTGTICRGDDDCPGEGASTCLGGRGEAGFCTVEGCGAGTCQGDYVCCRACSAAAAALLPFDGSACLPAAMSEQLTAAPVSCTCD